MAAVVQPVLPPPAAGAPVVRTYRAFYADAANDPYAGSYADVVNEYAVPLANANAPTPQQLAHRLYSSVQQGLPNAFIMLCGPPGRGRITLFHKIAKFYPRVGLPATQWDDRAFAYKGDVSGGGQIAIVDWEDQAFHQVPAQLRIPTMPTLEQALAADPDLNVVGPYGNADAGTEVVRVRRCSYIPSRYVGLLLEEDLQPKEALVRLWGAIINDGLTEDLEPLSVFLRACMTLQAPQQQDSPLLVAHPTAPVADALLFAHRQALLEHDLPALGTAALNLGAHQIAASIGVLTDEHRQARAAEAARRAAETKTPDTYFGTSVSYLLRLSHSATSTDLPDMWADLARSPKGQQRHVLQRALNESIARISPSRGFILTPALMTKIINLDFRMSNPEDLSTGIQPFVLGQGTPADRQEAHRLSLLYDLVVGGGASASLSDAQHVTESDTAVLPRTFAQSKLALTYMWVIVDMTLGPAHPWTLQLQAFITEYQQREMDLELTSTRDPAYRLMVPALITRWVQLRWSLWVDRQWNSPADVPAPDLLSLFSDIRLSMPWEPMLPSRYQTLVVPAPAAAPPPAAPPAARPPPAPPGAPAASPAATQQVANNRNYDAATFGRFRNLNVRIRDVLARARTDPPPLSTHNNPQDPQQSARDTPLRLCIAYHVKGQCTGRCGRRLDHNVLPDASRDELVAWCDRFFTEE